MQEKQIMKQISSLMSCVKTIEENVQNLVNKSDDK